MNFKHLSLSFFALSVCSNSMAKTLEYVPVLSYEKNATVIFERCVYKAKRWVDSKEYPVLSEDIISDNPWEVASCNMSVKSRENPENIQRSKILNANEYKENTFYQSGDVVRGVGSTKLYECKKSVSSWCSSSAWAYEPGKGNAWEQAWTLLSEEADNSQGNIDQPKPPPIDTGDGSEDHPNTTDFEYRSQMIGLTHAVVQYNQQSLISGEKAPLPSDYVVGGYVSEWSVYGRGFDLERLSGLSYNRLVYAFAGICGDNSSELASDIVRKECKKQNLQENEMVILDPWAGFIKPINQRQEKMGWHESYDQNNPQLISKNKVRGLMGQLQELKKHNENLKVAISIGGWTLSEPFHRMSENKNARDTFVASVIAFVFKWDLDGVDLDWEFPGHGGASGKWADNDGKNFSLLVKDMKFGLNALAKLTGKKYEVSSAVGATQAHISKIGKNYKLVDEYIDNIYLMNYDFFGAWENKLGHQSNLKHSSSLGADFSIENAVSLLQKNGLNKNKIVIGIANYSRGAQAPLHQSSPVSSGPVKNEAVFGTWESTVVEGYDLFPNMAGNTLKGVNGWELRTDKEANADYYYNYETQIFHSIDTPRTAYVKAKYAKDNGLKGVFVWTVEQDYNGQTVNAMNDGLGHSLTSLYTTTLGRKKLYTQCGSNVSESDCSKLNGEEITLTEPLVDPEEQLAVKHLHLFNQGVLIKKFRIWEGNNIVYESPNGLTAGHGNLITNIKIKRDTRIEVMALQSRSIEINEDNFPEILKLHESLNEIRNSTAISNGKGIEAIDFIAGFLGIPLSWGDLFLSIFSDVLDEVINSFKYKHHGWVNMNDVVNSDKTEVMISSYGYNDIRVKGYR